MDTLIEAIINEEENGTETVEFDSYDADYLGNLHCKYCDAINKRANKYEDNVRLMISAFPTVNLPSEGSIVLREDFPRYAISETFEINAESIMNSAHLKPTVVDAKNYINDAVVSQLNDCGNDFGSLKDFNHTFCNGSICCRREIPNTMYNKLADRLKVSMLGTVDSVKSLAKMYTDYKSIETPNDYIRNYEIFKYGLLLFYFMCRAYARLYTRMYNYITQKPEAVQNIIDANNKCAELDHKKAYIDNIQRQWKEKHDGANNFELWRKRDTLNEEGEKLKKQKEELEAKYDAELEDKSKEDSVILKAIAADLIDIYEKYDHKEFLENVARLELLEPENLKRQISRSDDDIKDIYVFDFPIFKTVSNNPTMKDDVRNNFVPIIAKKVFDRGYHNKFTISTAEPSPDDSLYISLVYNTKPVNESVNVYSKEQYSIKREGRFYVAYDPEGNSLGNEDTLSEAEWDIKEDMADREKRHALDESVLFEESLSKEERDELDESDFGIPEIRAYPLTDEEHIRKAIQFFNYAKSDYKQTLAKNIEKKVIKYDLVGKVTVGEKNPGRKYFHAWMITGSGATLVKKDNTYQIIIDGKEVEHGTLSRSVSTQNESFTVII